MAGAGRAAWNRGPVQHRQLHNPEQAESSAARVAACRPDCGPTRMRIRVWHMDAMLVAEHVRKRFGVEHKTVSIYDMLHKLGFSCTKPMPKQARDCPGQPRAQEVPLVRALLDGMFECRFYDRAGSDSFVDMLGHLHHRYGKLILSLDNAGYHKPKKVARFVYSCHSDIVLAYLPPYAPETKATEGQWKTTSPRKHAVRCHKIDGLHMGHTGVRRDRGRQDGCVSFPDTTCLGTCGLAALPLLAGLVLARNPV